MNFLYLFHTCFSIELTLTIYAALARLLFRIDVDPPFGNYFFLSTSFQDFWGKRWNSMVPGLMHELIVFYIGRKQPCWDALGFLFLQGVCLALEIKVKSSLNGKWKLNKLFSILLMDGLLICSCFRVFLRCFERYKFPVMVTEDIANFAKFLKNVLVNQSALN
ncbi:hypothetical protein C5167_005079 [Papaver somniferum]|uniref:Wax synthase domain-containing protein n=1 Tax=Papaver somniferum TaxID=3469 RepID=A0A4Y7JDE2_PAPSO|nr:hypothetical protein C5167_005079 [Papaver somniferum]